MSLFQTVALVIPCRSNTSAHVFITLCWLIQSQTTHAQTLKEVAVLPGHGSYVISSLALSADGKLLASASLGRDVKLWDLSSRKEVKTFLGHTDYVWDIAFSPAGTMLASASKDDTIILWNVRTGEQLAILRGHTFRVGCIAWSPDGETLVSGGEDKTIRYWDVARRKELAVIKPHGEGAYDLAMTRDGKTLISASGIREEDGHRRYVSGELKFWTMPDFKEVRAVRGHSDAIHRLALSPDDRVLATASYDNTVKLWDVAAGKDLATLEPKTESVCGLAFSPDGTMLATGSKQVQEQKENQEPKVTGVLQLWDVRTAKARFSVQAHSRVITAIIWTSDGKTLITASADGGIRLWSVIP